ncbi:hypothetical protein BH09MYX1_BH09MYX1_53250 [soil metagenome]
MRFSAAVLPLFLASFAVGCSPYLSAKSAPNSRAFMSPVRCGQGPFELHSTSLGTKWGESVALYQSGGTPVAGHAQIWVDGKMVTEGDVGGGLAPSNQACVLSAGDLVAAGGSSSVGGGGTSVPGGYSPNPPPTSTSGGPPPTLVEINGGGGSSSDWRSLLRWGYSVDDWDVSNRVIKPGVDIKVIFWSNVVLDLQNVHFVIGQTFFVPSSGDEKWVAHLNEKKADREKRERAEKEEREAEAKKQAAETDRCRALAMKSALDEKCKDAGWHDVSEAELDRRCNGLALQNAVDEACRKVGWHNDNERPDYRAGGASGGGGQPITSWSGGGGSSYTGGGVAKPRDPDGPPPAPRVELKTPQPSEHAEWITGSWRWGGSDWQWLSGGWKVPDVDRVQKKTPTAPTAPPPLQAEARGSAPVAGAAWVDGYWAWSGAWVWVPGRWSMPPQTGATWRPNVWVPEGVSVRLDPGAWIFGR